MNKSFRKNLKICFFIAIEAIFCFTPLGTIPIGPIVATLSMIPVVVVGLAYGKWYGMILGLAFATYSFIYWTFVLPAYPTAFIFTPFSQFSEYKGNVGSLIICFLPRILAGFLVGSMHKKLGDVLASAIGSLTNTFLVLFLIFVFFSGEYESIMGKPILVVIGLSILTNGLPECFICMVVCPFVAKIIRRIDNVR